MTTYTITVNGHAVGSVKAHSRDSAINKWLIEKYGSVFSSRAPYNVSAHSSPDES